MKGLYSFPDFDGVDVGGWRLGGPGLGNNLFPWARSAVFAHLTGATEIRPTWSQVNPRRLLRRDSDQRRYQGVSRSADEVTGLKKYRLLVGQKKLRARTLGEGLAYNGHAGIVCHAGMQGLFTELLPWAELLRHRFMRLTPTFARNDLNSVIVAHVRRGDFVTSGATMTDLEMLHRGAPSIQIPDEWYGQAITEARALLGVEAPVLVVSDAPAEQLVGITGNPGVEIASSASPWQDLHTLLGAGVRISSASTFSDWAAFLATGPSLLIRGQNRLGIDERFIEL